ncbi:MAG TPA: HAMP domain-containing sensor histidine kinase [Baekduia sp.]|uniref:sensor histidine kinase n=1 Tax=Baekduia sp. TaxID=2600305 RepID=UPI002CD6DFA3|nr:HAMP domain-containing sensor histidine kinase [Baekduia sp.]HMJ34020.1 HAMP domain-containing sensor histidine kinase [Baekduia sp.]
MSLRTRLLLALLVTSVVTLGVAALALLSPLQTRLRTESRDSVRSTVLATRGNIEAELSKHKWVYDFRANDAAEAMRKLSARTGARVILYPSAIDPVRTVPPFDTGSGKTELDDVFQASGTGRTVQSNTEAEGTRLAVPLPVTNPHFILAVRRPDTESAQAVDVVRSAFLTAAVFGLGVALLLGIILSTGLSRRLGRLRRSALALAADGVNAPAPPVDDGQDEVGDLARALASMQRALRRQEEARRAFVATASHELRTPLTSLQGNLELLTEDLDAGHLDVEDASAVLRGAQGQLRRLSNLASELLDLSRLDAGVELRREPVELGELTRAVAAEFELRSRDRSVALEIVPPTGPVWAAGDPGAVARVARILIDNALRFSPAGEAIHIAAAYHGERATLEVGDHGPGVPVEEREVIFERFQRGTRTGGEGGFGLGLAIGRELARRLDGELELTSRTGGAGARFTLTLPIELPRGSGHGDDEADGEAGAAGDAPAAAPSMRGASSSTRPAASRDD